MTWYTLTMAADLQAFFYYKVMCNFIKFCYYLPFESSLNMREDNFKLPLYTK